ncbi:MAG TPA: hypothetical protein VHU17_01160 [Acidimicrobiales bacterium]|jgi:hypothetical protein|nr:hypothetical protein [Acidimicrobiales bacterium]
MLINPKNDQGALVRLVRNATTIAWCEEVPGPNRPGAAIIGSDGSVYEFSHREPFGAGTAVVYRALES